MLSKKFIAKTRRFRDFIVTFQWVNDEPSMCILRAFNGRKSAYVIGLSSAYKYTDDAYLVRQSIIAAGVFGMHGEKSAVKSIADCIIENLDDLVKMKPEPDEAVVEREGPKMIPEWDGVNRILTLH